MSPLKKWILARLAGLWRKLLKPDLAEQNRVLRNTLERLADRAPAPHTEHLERISELIEARAMSGAGPWKLGPAAARETDTLIRAAAESIKSGIPLRESSPALAQGAYGDIELALQNVEWRREINLSWLEFTRWGIQQIILISRLYFVKNPLINRGVNIASYYVFGRGVDVSCSDPDGNDVLKEFFERNQRIVGQTALCELQKRLYYDGNVFFTLFSDTQDKGSVNLRTIDTTEIQDIATNPDDSDEPWFYKRVWTQKVFNPANGDTSTQSSEAWYPALGYQPDERMAKIGTLPVMWDSPVLHMQGGCGVSKWHFDVPKVYAALDWAREARRFLEAGASIKQALKQVAMVLTTKGGQQALAGAKQQLSTTVGPDASLWDQNPPAVSGSIFASGPGTKLEAFNTRGAGGDLDEVRQFKLMVCMVLDIPESFLADMNTSNLATALALDRPTELGFMEKQERWREVLVRIATYVLEVSSKAPSGRLREALDRRKAGKVVVLEARRSMRHDGRYGYEAAKTKSKADQIEVKCIFPAIREGDQPALVKSIAEAMTLDNTAGEVVGIDEKTGVLLLLQQLGVETAEELVEEMYPEKEYDPDRTKEPEPEPAPIAPVPPQVPPGPAQPAAKATEAATRLIEALLKLKQVA